MAVARGSREALDMRLPMLVALPLALACGPADEGTEDSAGAETTVGSAEPAAVPRELGQTMEAGVTELYRLANGARYLRGKAIQAECEDCWPPEVELLRQSEIEPSALEPRVLAEVLGELVAALEPVGDRAPFDALAGSLEAQTQELLARSEPFEPAELIAQATAALAPIRAAITAEATLDPAEPVLCRAGLQVGSGQLTLWELEVSRAASAAEKAGDQEEAMRIVGIIQLSRQHFETLSIALETGPEAAVSAIRDKLIFFRSFDTVFDRGDDEAVLQATADLCEAR